jgi:hypothetical protein
MYLCNPVAKTEVLKHDIFFKIIRNNTEKNLDEKYKTAYLCNPIEKSGSWLKAKSSLKVGSNST